MVTSSVNINEVVANDTSMIPFTWRANTQLMRIDILVVLNQVETKGAFRFGPGLRYSRETISS